MRLLLFLALSFSILSCKSDKTFELSKIEGFPPEINGCSCYYAINQEDFTNQKFIYLDKNGDEPGLIKRDGDLIPVDPNNKNPEGYQIIFDIEKEIQLDQELYHKEGTLTVIDPDGAVFITSIYGECGCL